MVELREQRRVGEMRLEKQPEARSRRASWDMMRTLSSVFICKHQGPLGRRFGASCKESGLLSSCWCSSTESFCAQNFWFSGLETALLLSPH